MLSRIPFAVRADSVRPEASKIPKVIFMNSKEICQAMTFEEKSTFLTGALQIVGHPIAHEIIAHFQHCLKSAAPQPLENRCHDHVLLVNGFFIAVQYTTFFAACKDVKGFLALSPCNRETVPL